ncbi:extracellular solute-binding protein [Glycomyces halotolerans]
MATPSRRSPFRRRSLFKAAGLGAAGAAGLPVISACGDVSSNSGSAQSVDVGLDILPNHVPFDLPHQPDLVGDPPNHPSAFLNYPSPVEPAVTDMPSNSGEYTVRVPNWGPVMDSDDPYWEVMREATGGTKIKFDQIDGNTYGEASVTWLQANDFGDAIMIPEWNARDDHTNFGETVVNRFADITDIVSGDIADRWPLLAARPTKAWANSVWSTDPENQAETARIYGVPWIFEGGPSNACFYRVDLLEEAGLDVPTTVEELLELARTWSDDSAGKWAFAGVDWFSPAWFGLAGGHGWRQDGDEMLHDYERPEYREWIEFQRTLVEEKLQHPDAGTDALDAPAAFVAGDVLIDQNGWGAYDWMPDWGTGENPDFKMAPLPPLGYGGRDPLVSYATNVSGWLFFRKDMEVEQIEELLDVCNACAAPIGTKEFELIQYGVEGTHFEYDEDGAPAFTEEGNNTKNDSLAYTAMSGKTEFFLQGKKEVVETRFEYNENALQYMAENQFEGLRMEASSAGAAAGQTMDGIVQDIIRGRAEMSAFDDALEQWRADGGDADRELFKSAYDSLH